MKPRNATRPSCEKQSEAQPVVRGTNYSIGPAIKTYRLTT